MIGIKDMKMPKNCGHCRFSQIAPCILYCCATIDGKVIYEKNKKLKECPLKEIKNEK